MGLEVDPAVSRADSLVGCTVGHPGKLPALVDEVRIRIAPLARTMEIFPAGLGKDEPLVLGVGTNTTIGFVTDKKKNVVALKLRKPACIDSGSKIAVMRQAQKRWRLYGTASLCPAGS
jgi:translation initiation factor 2 subunit 3